MKERSLVLLVACLLDLAFLFAQQGLRASDALDARRSPRSFSTAQGATITGTVVDARTMQPLRGAIVSAACVASAKPDPPANIGFRTGTDGKFTLRGVAPGIVNFFVTKAGYVSGPFASVRPATDGERIPNVTLTVPPGASLGGRIVDESGQPMAGAMVMVQTTGKIPSGLRPPSLGAVIYADEDGRYWVGGLAAGEYTISVAGLNDTAAIFSFGGDLIFRAGANAPPPLTTKFELAVGEDRSAADLVVRFSDRFTGPAPIDTGAATIAGQVVDSSGGAVPHVPVVLRQIGKGGGTYTTRADASGRFQFLNVAEGSFSIGTTGPGATSNAAAGAGGAYVVEAIQPTILQVAAGTRTDSVVLLGSRGGAISGTLTDEFGDPVFGAVVAMAPSAVIPSGDSTSIVAGPDGMRLSGRAGAADARGRYRITGLPPGEYFISAGTPGPTTGRTEIHFEDHGGQDRVLANGPVFYPGAPSVTHASRIVVAEGRESGGVDMVVRPLLVSHINVTVTAPRPVNEIQLRQIMFDDRLPMLEKALKLTESSVTLDARPGRYRLLASAEVASNADNVVRLWAQADVETDPLLPATVNLVLEPGANVSGRIIFEGKEPNRQNAGASLMPLTPLPGIRIDGNSTLTVATGEFSIEGVMPGRYVIQAGAKDRRGLWMLKSAMMRGRDVLDEPIDLVAGDEIDGVRLTMTDQISEVSGRVLDAADRPIRDRWVVIFAADKRYWWPGSRRVRAVQPDQNGRYVARGLPPGRYLVALVSDVATEYELIAKLPSLVSSGVRVTLADGERKEQDLRSVRRRS